MNRGTSGAEETTNPPCYSTFRARYKEVWYRYIKIRGKCEHAQCTYCWELHKVIQDSGKSLDARREAASRLRQHHRDQYLDRVLYWNLRFRARRFCNVDRVRTVL